MKAGVQRSPQSLKIETKGCNGFVSSAVQETKLCIPILHQSVSGLFLSPELDNTKKRSPGIYVL